MFMGFIHCMFLILLLFFINLVNILYVVIFKNTLFLMVVILICESDATSVSCSYSTEK